MKVWEKHQNIKSDYKIEAFLENKMFIVSGSHKTICSTMNNPFFILFLFTRYNHFFKKSLNYSNSNSDKTK